MRCAHRWLLALRESVWRLWDPWLALFRFPHSTSFLFVLPYAILCDVVARAAPEATPLDKVAFTRFLDGGFFVHLKPCGACNGVFGSASRGHWYG